MQKLLTRSLLALVDCKGGFTIKDFLLQKGWHTILYECCKEKTGAEFALLCRNTVQHVEGYKEKMVVYPVVAGEVVA